MIPFPEETLQSIITDIDQALDKGATPIAAFDADGTLWDTDIGENFFEYQIEQNLLTNLPEDPFTHYTNLYQNSTPDALKWLATVNAGQKLEDVKTWASDALRQAGTLPLFPAQQEIVEHLQKKGVEIYIVTASMKWAVEPAARYYNIDADHVLGITALIDNGTITDSPGPELTWREGKMETLLKYTNNKKPFFSSGNSEGDISLLEHATHIRLVHAASDPDSDLFETEQKMVKVAKENNWHFHSYHPSPNS